MIRERGDEKKQVGRNKMLLANDTCRAGHMLKDNDAWRWSMNKGGRASRLGYLVQGRRFLKVTSGPESGLRDTLSILQYSHEPQVAFPM